MARALYAASPAPDKRLVIVRGGGHNDLGMMSRFHWAQMSDDWWPVSALKILSGMTLALPPEACMSLLGNVLWIVLGGGILLFLEYLIGGFLICLTLVGIPFGVQCFKIAALSLLPFGRKISRKKSAGGCLAVAMNLIWILVGGIWICLTHLVFALLCALTLIGIPFAKQHIKLAALSLTPFGHTVD